MTSLLENEIPSETWLYSFKESGWFSTKYNLVIPEDAVLVDEVTMLKLKAGLAAGQVLVKDQNGKPCLADRPPPSVDTLAEIERRWRDRQQALADPLVVRHRDEVELGKQPTLDEVLYEELQVYRAALRDWPQSPDFPQAEHRPVAPSWIAEQTQ